MDSPEGTPTDGNCQFIAVARALGFPDDSHLELRRNVVDYLKKHRQEFEGFLQGSWDRYVAYITAPGAWGDHVTLAILARIFKCEIVVVSDSPGHYYEKVITPPVIKKERILIAHYDEVHYESTVPI